MITRLVPSLFLAAEANQDKICQSVSKDGIEDVLKDVFGNLTNIVLFGVHSIDSIQDRPTSQYARD